LSLGISTAGARRKYKLAARACRTRLGRWTALLPLIERGSSLRNSCGWLFQDFCELRPAHAGDDPALSVPPHSQVRRITPRPINALGTQSASSLPESPRGIQAMTLTRRLPAKYPARCSPVPNPSRPASWATIPAPATVILPPPAPP